MMKKVSGISDQFGAERSSASDQFSTYRFLKSVKNRFFNHRTERLARRYVFPFCRLGEWMVFGGRLRHELMISAVRLHYRSLFRRSVVWFSEEAPHFSNNVMGFFQLGFEKRSSGPFPFYRGFYNSEIVSRGDAVLDIGCGDGFLTRVFLSPRASRVDAIDIEPSAIKAAQRDNQADNISYYLRDAVKEPFPQSEQSAYDVIVWDGALGHFPPDTTIAMLEKIKQALSPQGIFAGSESLGRLEGTDHLQFFDTADDLVRLFQPFFSHIQLKVVEYEILAGFKRTEAYWRCSHEGERLEQVGWEYYQNDAQNGRKAVKHEHRNNRV